MDLGGGQKNPLLGSLNTLQPLLCHLKNGDRFPHRAVTAAREAFSRAAANCWYAEAPIWYEGISSPKALPGWLFLGYRCPGDGQSPGPTSTLERNRNLAKPCQQPQAWA